MLQALLFWTAFVTCLGHFCALRTLTSFYSAMWTGAANALTVCEVASESGGSTRNELCLCS